MLRTYLNFGGWQRPVMGGVWVSQGRHNARMGLMGVGLGPGDLL